MPCLARRGRSQHLEHTRNHPGDEAVIVKTPERLREISSKQDGTLREGYQAAEPATPFEQSVTQPL